MADPVLHVIVGPNGAGKTTLYEEVVAPVTGLRWVNADQIAALQWPDDPVRHAYDAAKLAADVRSQLIAQRVSFATETVFSHPSKVELVREAAAAGYLVTVHAVMVPEALSVARVAERVRHGGHDVGEAKIRERYRRLWPLVADAVRLAWRAVVYDNSRAATPLRAVAHFEQGVPLGPIGWPTWTPSELVALAP